MQIVKWVAYDFEDFQPSGLDLQFRHWSHEGITAYCTTVYHAALESFMHLLNTYLNKHMSSHTSRSQVKQTLESQLMDAYKTSKLQKWERELFTCLWMNGMIYGKDQDYQLQDLERVVLD